MKICIITEYFPTTDTLDIKGGAEACAFNEAKYLAKNHEVTVLTSFEPSVKRKDRISGINIVRCGRKREYTQSGSLFNRFSFMRDACKIGARGNFDIVVGYNFVTYPVAWKISKKLKKPCAIRYHDMWIGEWIKNFGIIGIIGEIMERYILSRDLDVILPVSVYTKNKLKGYFDSTKIRVVPNIVDIPKIEAKKFKNPTISCVSRLVEYKRVEDILNAVSIVKKDIPNIHCKIVGTGPKESYLKKLAENLKITENVDFCGFIEDHDDVLKIVKSSHLFCFPSVVEGFGIVIVESMALGVPFIASDIPPLIEASGRKGGLFFKPKNYKEMADKIKYLLNNEKLQNDLKKEGMIKSEDYTGEKISHEIECIYKELIKNL